VREVLGQQEQSGHSSGPTRTEWVEYRANKNRVGTVMDQYEQSGHSTEPTRTEWAHYRANKNRMGNVRFGYLYISKINKELGKIVKYLRKQRLIIKVG
jgi:hypothetical protein